MPNIETFQLHCPYCLRRFEADSYESVVKVVEDHEQEKHRDQTSKRKG